MTYVELDNHLLRASTFGYPFFNIEPGYAALVKAVLEGAAKAYERVLLAALIAKIDNPAVDIRAPYSDLMNGYSGRGIDEGIIQEQLYIKKRLVQNATTGFLTPAFRTNMVLTRDCNLVSRDRAQSQAFLELLDAVHVGEIPAENLLPYVLKKLLDRRAAIDTQMASLREKSASHPELLSSRDIYLIIESHLKAHHASRLPVLIVAAIYKTIGEKIGERVLRLYAHTASDDATGALGDLSILVIDTNQIGTVYEMKCREISQSDILIAVEKCLQFTGQARRVDNIIFVSTVKWSEEVRDCANRQHHETGIEVKLFDVLGFTDFFLHFFHRYRFIFLQNYEDLLIGEDESAVSVELKKVFFALKDNALKGYDEI